MWDTACKGNLIRSRWTVLLLALFLSAAAFALAPASALAAKAHTSYYSAILKKGAVLTPVKEGRKQVRIKKNTYAKILFRQKKEHIVSYKGKSYTVKASKVRIGGLILTGDSFSRKSAEHLVNTRLYNKKKFNSKSKYLVWISLSGQRVYVFKGKKGNWKLVRQFLCSTGRGGNGTPYGKGRVSGKQYVWYFNGSPVANYATRIPGGAMHTWRSGGFGYPRSHGCTRAAVPDAMFVYNNVPVGSAVYIL